MNDPHPLISVVIPVKNGDTWLDKTIQGILNQTLLEQTEIIIIDSGSVDTTLNLLSKYPVRLHQISPADFNHGGTRNLGVQMARGKYVVMTVQDAEPADQFWLQNLLDGFDEENVAGVCGQQIVPHDPDKNPVDWFRPISPAGKKKYHFPDGNGFIGLSPSEKKGICGWDNVNAMYKREVLLRVPFRELPFSEDAMWAKDVLEAGYAIVYNTKARVNHYHFETPDFTFRRSFTVFYHNYKLFDVQPGASGNELINLLRNVKLLLNDRKVGWSDKWKWLLFNYRQRKAINKAVHLFNTTLAEGGNQGLDFRHSEICSSPPQAVKPTK